MAKPLIIMGLSLGAVLILQLGLLAALIGPVYTPNLALIFILLLACQRSDAELFGVPLTTETVLISSAAAGLVLDLLSFGWFGMFTIFFLASAGIVRYVSDRFFDTGFNNKNIALVFFLSTLFLPLMMQFINDNFLPALAFLVSLAVASLAIIGLGGFIYVRAR